MSDYFKKSSNVELSLLYYLENSLATDWSSVGVRKSFASIYSGDLPSICIRMLDRPKIAKEVGSTTLRTQFLISIDVFSRDDREKLDLSEAIADFVKEGFVYYEHSQNVVDNKVLDRSENGRVQFLNFTEDRPVDFGETVEKYDKYRHFISFMMEKS